MNDMNGSLKELREGVNDRLKAFKPHLDELESLLKDIPDDFIDLFPYNKIDWNNDSISVVMSKATKLSELWKNKDASVI